MSENPVINQNETLSDMRSRFLRHLSTDSNISELSQQFGLLNSNLDRVNFVLDLLNKYKIESGFKKDGKNKEEARKLRELGNDFFKLKKIREAWEMYTKSIALAENNSEDLALAFANRSAVLFELNLHDQCLQDIERAFANNYPTKLHEKLQKRSQKSQNLLSQPRQAHTEPIPLILDENPLIECASDCISIKNDPEDDLGRHVVSTRDIHVGEILAVEKPFALVVVNGPLNHCHECLALSFCLIPCDICTETLYCSTECKTRASPWHQYECPILSTVNHVLKLDKLKRLPLKIALMASILATDHDQQADYYHSGRYTEIHNLITNTHRRSVSDLFQRATNAAIIYGLVEKYTTFVKDYNGDEFKERLLRHLMTGPSNFHEITEMVKGENDVLVPEEVGSGAFAFLSMFNHSCSPNVARFCYGNTVVLRVIEEIKEGEQCFDNYGYHHALTPKIERQKQLKSQYYFDCICEACCNNWDLFDNLKDFKEAPQINDNTFKQLSIGDVPTALNVLDDLIDDLNACQRFKPSRNFCQIKEMVKQAFAIFGTKNRLF